MENKRLWLFIALAFGLTWGLILVCTLLGMPYGSPGSTIWLSACMLMPALASILTRAFTKEGFKGMGWKLGFEKGGWKSYLAAFFLPFGCMLAGAAVYFLIFPSRFDASASLLRQALAASGVPEGQVPLVVGMQVITGFVMGPIINLPFTLGEELGWRAYMLPKLAGLRGRRGAILLSGVIWGLWHAPMIALGHNYGLGYWGWPWLGILAMVVFCLAMGSFEGYLTFRAGSVWPAAMAHSSLNAIASLPVYFAVGASSPFIGPMMTGILGGSALLALGLWCYFRCGRGEEARAPQGDV